MIINDSACSLDNKFIVPCAGKLFRSSIGKNNKALSFVLNKGYLETKTLEDMLNILDFCLDSDFFVLVGAIEKVRLKNSTMIKYRQRLFFKSLEELLNICKKFNIWFDLSDSFHIGINSMMNCLDDLKYLEKYASSFGADIDTWLTNVLRIHLVRLLKLKSMPSEQIMRDSTFESILSIPCYMHRAPFLVSRYSIKTKTSSLFISSSDLSESGALVPFGYTTKNVKKDIKNGVFK